jgi:hypothetical protein
MSTQEIIMEEKYQVNLGASEFLSIIADKTGVGLFSSRIEDNNFWLWKTTTREWALNLHGNVKIISEDHSEITIKTRLKGETIVILSLIFSAIGLGVMIFLRDFIPPLVPGILWISILVLSLSFHKRFTRSENNELIRFFESLIIPFKANKT